MGLNPKQVRELVIRPALEFINLHSPAAEELVFGTGAHESHYTYLHQVKGPALGLFQMEPASYIDLWDGFVSEERNGQLKERLRTLAGSSRPPADVMVWNLRFAAAMCRVYYRRVREPLPAAGDLEGQAAYWKKYYNTALGKGTVAQYAKSWATYA